MSSSPFEHRFFTPEMREQLDQLVKYDNNTEIITNEAARVLLRTKELSGSVKTFTMSTSAHPNDKILYQANTNTVVLSS